MGKPNLHEQAERCCRLARDSIDRALRDSLLKLADEYAERTGAKDNVVGCTCQFERSEQRLTGPQPLAPSAGAKHWK